MTIDRANRYALGGGIVVFLIAVSAGFMTSLLNWTGPEPTLEFLKKTDLSRIYIPAFIAPFWFSVITFPASLIVPGTVAMVVDYGIRRHFWPFTLGGWVVLALYWYGLVAVALSLD